MKKSTDEDLSDFLRKKFETFESEPITTWSQLEPNVTASIPAPKGRLLIVGVVLLLFILGIVSFVVYNPVSQETIFSKEHNSKQVEDAVIEKKDNASNPIETASSSRNLNHKPAAFVAMHLLDEVTGISKRISNDPSTEPMTRYQEGRGQGRDVSFTFESPRVALAVPPLKPLKASDLIIIKEKEVNKKITPIEWWGSFLVSYNTAYFRPLSSDQVQVQKFWQSRSIVDNRLGITLNLKMRKQLRSGLITEYFAGVSYSRKHFGYAGSELISREGELSSFQKTVDGSIATGLIGGSVYIKRVSFPKTLWLSIAYQQTFSAPELRNYFSPNQARLGIGLPVSVTDKIQIVPQIGYFLPLRNKFVDFQMNTILWGIEINGRLNLNRSSRNH